MPTLLTIAGFDPSSGAGVTADLATFAAHGCFGTACPTALTVQSTLGVRAVEPTAASLVTATLRCLEDDLPADGIKIGMLATSDHIRAVTAFLEQMRVSNPHRLVVLDPVLRSSSGHDLLPSTAIEAFKQRLMPMVDWITPNLDELARLTRRPEPLNRDTILDAAHELQKSHPQLGLLVTGGHMDPPDDLLVAPGGDAVWISGKPLLQSRSTHGTGCALSSAFLSEMVLGASPLEAARSAKNYVYRAIASAPGLGKGRGPLNHLWTRPLKKTPSRP